MTSFAPLAFGPVHTIGTPVVSDASWSLLVAETRTGRVVGRLEMVKQSWDVALDWSAGVGNRVTVALDGPPGDDDRSITRQVRAIVSGGWRFMLVAVYGTQAVAFGYIVTAVPSADGSTCDIGMTDLPGLLKRRPVVATGFLDNPTAIGADVTFQSSLAGIAVHLFQLATAEYGANLPLVLGSPATSMDNIRNYAASDLADVSTRLAQLSETIGGPDLVARPVLSDDQSTVTIQVQIGEPYAGQLGDPWVWSLPGSCSQVTPEMDASSEANRWYVPGNGISTGTPVGVAADYALIDAGYPLLVNVDGGHGSVVEQSTMDAQAEADLDAYLLPLESWTCYVSANEAPFLGSYGVGDTMILQTNGHNWIPDGRYRRRIVGYSFDETAQVKIICAAVPGEI